MGDLDHFQQEYRDKIDALRIANDLAFGIVSQRKGNTWVRDATQALDLYDATLEDVSVEGPKRPHHEDLAIEANNTLLRMLTRLRPIDYMISKQSSLEDQQKIRGDLRQKFEKLYSDLKAPELTKASIKEHEEVFNTFLIEQLHQANLTKGCSTKKDAEALLAHYKVLYSVLDPAMTLVTLTYDKGTQILQRETQYPVTEKTEFQKNCVGILKTVIPHPLESEINSHTVHNEAKQQADACFADLLVDDKRMLTSQARKTHLVGVKNAFIVKVETLRESDAEDVQRMRQTYADHPLSIMDDDTPLWLGRMAVPVYVGKGEKYTNEHVKANLEQLQIAAKKHMKHKDDLNIHLTTLNTYTNIDGEKQDVMIDGLNKAMEELESEISVIPINDVGMFYTPKLAESIQEKQEKGKIQPGKKADRLDLAVDVTLNACQQPNTISFVNCAGGADRTGTVIEEAIQRHTANKMGVDKVVIEHMRARGFNSAEIAHQMVPGTPGMKPCSKANNWFGWGRKTFSDVAAREFYLNTADLNKKNKVKHVDCFKNPSKVAMDEYNTARKALEKAIRISKNDQGVIYDHKKKGAAILRAEMLTKKEATPQDIANRTALYIHVTEAINELNEKGEMTEVYFEKIHKINEMSKMFFKKDKLKKSIENFLMMAVVSIAIVIIVMAPVSSLSIFLAASVLIASTAIKVAASFNLFGQFGQFAKDKVSDMASNVMAALGEQSDDVLEAGHSFAQEGMGFFTQRPEPETKTGEDSRPDKGPAPE